MLWIWSMIIKNKLLVRYLLSETTVCNILATFNANLEATLITLLYEDMWHVYISMDCCDIKIKHFFKKFIDCVSSFGGCFCLYQTVNKLGGSTRVRGGVSNGHWTGNILVLCLSKCFSVKKKRDLTQIFDIWNSGISITGLFWHLNIN